eukprot:TRINITY_DN4004_c0_g1_i1.p1 TRINITY_DN4004_c0_g1~~TRINITY_DN4004_c0_g1_i1.p1  ORF type:complete len:324 (-),score=43.59 TRINITY_DN4004_c0_g1_i1:43-1014(-)
MLAKFRNLRVITEPVPVANEPYTLSDTGTFRQDSLKINLQGLQIGSIPRARDDGVGDFCEFQDLNCVLGYGSSGVVRKFLHTPTGNVYALKVVAFDIRTEVKRNQVLAELRTLHASTHPSIVQFHGAFYHEGNISIALEYMDSGSLLDVVYGYDPIPERVLSRLTRQLLDGINYMHRELRVIHRDIKPANLLVNSRGEVRITDFGTSGKLSQTWGQAQTFVGTCTYMSPERIRGSSHGGNSDIWSLGLTLLECAIGRYPYNDLLHASCASTRGGGGGGGGGNGVGEGGGVGVGGGGVSTVDLESEFEGMGFNTGDILGTKKST